MPKCFLCGQESAEPTCAACLAAAPADASAVKLEDVLARPESEAPSAGEQTAGIKRLQRWNSILDESPIFAGQGAFEVLTPVAPAPGTLDVAVGVRFDVASAPADADPVVHMMVTLSPYGAPLMSRTDGPTAHLILCLDLSASMDEPQKYPVLRAALSSMLRELRSRWSQPVLISIVGFAWGSDLLLDAVPSSVIDEEAVLRLLDEWPRRFSRYTDMAGALRIAGRIAADQVRAVKAMPVRIYVLTDGRPQDVEGTKRILGKVSKLPVDIHGFGFGDDADVRLLNEMLAGGRGASVKMVRPDTLGEAFGRVGEVSQLVVANRALLDVELRPGVIGGGAYRYRPARHRFGTGAFARGVHFSTDLGTLESGRTYSLVFQLRLRRTTATETEVARICLRVPGFGGPRTFEKVVSIQRHPGNAIPERDTEVVSAVEIVQALDRNDPATMLKSLKIRRSIYAQERRDPHILAVLDKAIRELETKGSLASLTASEHAALISHTLTTRAGRPAASSASSASSASPAKPADPSDLVTAEVAVGPAADDVTTESVE